MDNKFELPREGVRIYDPKSGWQDSADKSSAAADEPNRAEPPEYSNDHDQDDPSDPSEQDHFEEDAYEEQDPLDEQEPEESEELESLEPDAERETLEDGQQDTLARNSTRASRHDELLDPLDASQSHSPEAFAAEALRSLSDNLSSSGSLAGYSGPSRTKPAAGLVPQGQAAALAKVGDSLDGLFTVIQRSTLANSVDGSAPSWRDVANISRHLEGRLNSRQDLLKELTKVDREIRDTRDDLLLTLKALSEFEQQNLQAASMRASISSVAARVIAKRFEESGGD